MYNSYPVHVEGCRGCHGHHPQQQHGWPRRRFQFRYPRYRNLFYPFGRTW